MVRSVTDAVPDELRDDAAAVDWIGAAAALDECDAYALVVVDPQTGDVDSYGPYGGVAAVAAADEARRAFDAEGLDDVVVRVTRMHLRGAAAAA